MTQERATAAVRLSSTGLDIAGDGLGLSALAFLDSILRGVGQVMLQNNSYAGVLFLIGIFYNSWLFGTGVLVGAAVSTASGMLFGADKTLVRAGLFGFNGALVAIPLGGVFFVLDAAPVFSRLWAAPAG